MGLFTTNDSDSDNGLSTNFYFPTSKNALIIFTRNPELGKCKTRIAKTIGDEAALEIYLYLINHIESITKNITVDKYVFYSDQIKEEDIWEKEIFKKKLQYGNDLGSRMENAFTELLGMGYQKIILIGSDLLELNSNHIENAFDLLSQNDYVIGPAHDGGYYLIGLKSLNPEIFKNKQWGNSSVLKDTLHDLEGQSVSLLETLNDIDVYEDLRNFEVFKNYLI